MEKENCEKKQKPFVKAKILNLKLTKQVSKRGKMNQRAKF